MSYQVTDKNGKTHTSKAKTVKTVAEIIHWKDGKSTATWHKAMTTTLGQLHPQIMEKVDSIELISF